MSDDYGVFIDGTPVEREDIDLSDVSLSVQFGDSGPTCRHCGTDLVEYVDGWHGDSGWRAGLYCEDRWSADADEDESPDPDEDEDSERAAATRVAFAHEPADQDSPAQWANGAGVTVTADSIQLWASVFEPRGAFQFTVRRGQDEDGSPAVLLHTPYPGEPMPHAPLERISDGTMRVTERRDSWNLSPLGRIRAGSPSIVDIRTYADGFGRWHCEIDQHNGDHAAAGAAAWQALHGEIAERGRGDSLQGLTFDHRDSRDGILTSYFVEGDRPDTDTGYMADILDKDGGATVAVDLRTLPVDTLNRLRAEAGVAGDIDMVSTIDELTGAAPDTYATDQIDRMSPADGFYRLQITPNGSEQGTKWLNVSPAELSAIRAVFARRTVTS